VKRLLRDISPLERRWLEVIEQKFGLAKEKLLSVPGQYIEDADHLILSHEVAALYWPVLPEWWQKFTPPSPLIFINGGEMIRCLSPSEARRRFLHRFQEIQLQLGDLNPWMRRP
jgi:hypothetical protein